jgi:hypothetical protein
MPVERQLRKEKGRKFSSLGNSSETKRERGLGCTQTKITE